MWKRYIKFCQQLSNKMLEEKGMRDIGPTILTDAHYVAIVAIAIPAILMITQLPVACCVFLLYGFGTNIYTVPVTISSVAVSVEQFHSSISSWKNYVRSEEND